MREKSNSFLLLISLYIGLSMSGNIGLGGLKLTVVISFIIFIFLLLKRFNFLVKTNYRIDIIILFILITSVVYAIFLDSLSYESSLNQGLTKIFILLLCFVFYRYLSNLNKSQLVKIIQNSNIIFLIFNVLIFILSTIPSFKLMVYDISQYGVRLRGFHDQTNGFALIMIFNVSVATFCIYIKKNLLNFINLFLSLILILMTQSRGLLIGYFLAILITFLTINYKKRNFKKLYIVIIISLLIPSLYGLISMFMADFLYNKFGIQLSRFNPNSDRSVSNLSTNEANDRTYLFEAGLNILQEYPFGIGYTQSLNKNIEINGIHLISHNLFIETLLYYGFIFGTLWLLIFLIPIFKIFILDRIENIHFIALLYSLQIFLFGLTHASESIYIWIFLAFAYGILNNKYKENNLNIS